VNERAKKIIVNSVVIIALVAAAAFFADHRRKSIDARELDRQLALLDREHRARQRNLESNLGELGKLSQSAIASLDGTRDIIERTGTELHATAADLRSAKKILASLAIQIKDLQMELDNCRSDLSRIRILAGAVTGEIVSVP
jgi:chromosome segregation ATPase